MSIFKRKTKKEKAPRNWYQFAAKLTLALLLLVVLFFSLSDGFNFFKSSVNEMSGTLSLITKEVDTSTLLTDNSPEHSYNETNLSLIDKLSNSSLNLINGNEIDQNKFKNYDQILDNDLTLSDKEFALLCTSLVPTLTDGILIEKFLETTLTKNGDTFTLYTVTKLNLTKILEGMGKLEDIEVYLTNTYEISNDNNQFKVLSSTCKVNNLSASDSTEIIAMFDELLEKEIFSNLSHYFIEQLINNFGYKTNSSIRLDDHSFTFVVTKTI